MTIELPQCKKERVKLQIKKVCKLNKCSIREFATFMGTLGACCTALTYGWIHLKEFEREKFLALKSSDGNYDAYMSLSDRLNPDFQLWLDHIDNAIKPIAQFQSVFEIFTDASRSSSGVFSDGH